MSGDTLMTIILLIATVLLIAGNALYVFHEFAFVVLKPPDIKRFEASRSRTGRLIVRMTQRLDHYIAVDQLGITVTSIAVGWIGQPVIARLLRGPIEAVGLPSGAATAASLTTAFIFIIAVQMIAGELMPKTVALRHPRRVATLVAVPVEISARVFHPLVVVLNGIGTLIVRALGFSPQTESHAHVLPPEELIATLQLSAKAGVVSADPFAFRRALHFSDITARDLIVPRQDIVALQVGMSVEQIFDIVRRHRFTRYPVYNATIDDVAGVLNIKDLIQVGADGSPRVARMWRRLIRPIPVLPEHATIEQVLYRLTQEKQPMLLLVDEFGGTAGILTVSDIADELIGGDEDVRPNRAGGYVVKGETAVTTVESLLDISLGPEERDYESIGGLVMAELGRIPQVGDIVTVDRTTIEVMTMQGMRVRQVLLHTAQDPDEE